MIIIICFLTSISLIKYQPPDITISCKWSSSLAFLLPFLWSNINHLILRSGKSSLSLIKSQPIDITISGKSSLSLIRSQPPDIASQVSHHFCWSNIHHPISKSQVSHHHHLLTNYPSLIKYQPLEITILGKSSPSIHLLTSLSVKFLFVWDFMECTCKQEKGLQSWTTPHPWPL